MSRFLILPVALVVLGVAWLWGSGGLDQISAWAAVEQRDFQNRIARALRSLRGGEAGALGLLLTVCFAYGFFHAVGPGHGKIVIGGVGLGRRVAWARLAVISLIASLGQAITAIVLVYSGIWLFSMTRERMIGVAEDTMAPLSYGAIALIGLWLCWRGLRRAFAAAQPRGDGGGADHAHAHDGHECTHRHGPTMDEVERMTSPREALAIIGGIAMRPCTGALFVLIITWQMGIALAGIAGAFAMALGTASVTVAVGIASVSLRGGFVRAMANTRLVTRIVPMVEFLAGFLIVAVAAGLLLRALP